MDMKQTINTGLMFLSNLARLNPSPWKKCRKQAATMVNAAEDLEKQRDSNQTLLDADGDEVSGETPLDHLIRTLVYWAFIIAFIYLFTNVAKAIAAAILSVVATLIVLTALGKIAPSSSFKMS